MMFVSKATVYRITADQQLVLHINFPAFHSRKKKKNPALSCAETLELDHFDLEVIRRIIHTNFF
ncbi:hypothetical protein C0J52_14135 [Blattella germanica]|nr:hypothetical protein C0J52_14135 [Blattella germanica]